MVRPGSFIFKLLPAPCAMSRRVFRGARAVAGLPRDACARNPTRPHPTVNLKHFDPPPTILAYLEKAEYTFWHPHDGRIAAQLSRIVYLKQVHHLGCPSARKCGILCFSA